MQDLVAELGDINEEWDEVQAALSSHLNVVLNDKDLNDELDALDMAPTELHDADLQDLNNLRVPATVPRQRPAQRTSIEEEEELLAELA